MAYILSGSEGSFTTVTGDAFYTNLFGVNNAAGLVTVEASTLSISSESHDITPLNATNLKTLSGLCSFSASVSGKVFATPRMGNVNLVQVTDPVFYCTNARAFSITMSPYAVHDITAYHASSPGSGPTWRGNRPDPILRWSGSYIAGIDNTTPVRTGGSGTEPIQAPSITDGSSTLSNIALTYGDSATDEKLSGDAQITGYSLPVRRGEKQESVFSFTGSGALAAVGTNNLFTGNGISGGNVLSFPWSGTGTALVSKFFLKVAATNLYFQTVDMFATRFTINSEVGQPVTYSMDFIGNGALTSVST